MMLRYIKHFFITKNMSANKPFRCSAKNGLVLFHKKCIEDIMESHFNHLGLCINEKQMVYKNCSKY